MFVRYITPKVIVNTGVKGTGVFSGRKKLHEDASQFRLDAGDITGGVECAAGAYRAICDPAVGWMINRELITKQAGFAMGKRKPRTI